MQAKTAALPTRWVGPRSVTGEVAVPSGELERYVRVGVERVGEGDPMVAVRDVPFCDENRGQLLAGQDFLQVVQHARVRQRQWDALGGPQDVVGAAVDDWLLLRFFDTSWARSSPKRMLR